MAATPDHILLEVLVEKLQANDGLLQCSTAIRRLISDSELAVECLEGTVHDINRYKFVHVERALGCGLQFCGGVAAASGITGLLQYGLSNNDTSLYLIGITFGTLLMACGTGILRSTNTELDYRVNSIVRKQVDPIVKKLQGSTTELQKQWRGAAGMCATLCVHSIKQITWLSYLNCLDISTTTIIPVMSSANIFRSFWEFI